MTDLPDVAMAVHSWSYQLTNLGRYEEALVPATEAVTTVTETVDLYVPLVSAAPQDYRDEYDEAVDLLRRLS